MKNAIKIFIKYLLKIYRPIVNLKFRLKVLRLNLAEDISIDGSCVIYKGTIIKIWKGGRLKIAAHTEILYGTIILTYGGTIQIGRNCSINPYCIIYGHGGVEIGDNVLIAGGTMIIPSNHTFSNSKIPIAFQGNTAKGIVIEDDVWIGHACTILDGVKIGRGSVIAAGTVVTKNVEPFTVVGGVPGKVLKKRDSD